MIGVQEQTAGSLRAGPPGRISHSLRKALLSMVIERDVIPQLVSDARHADPAALSLEAPAWELMVADLTALALGSAAAGVTRYVTAQLADGCRAEDLCLHLLAPVARRLGQGWVDDECDFTDVTIGVWRLHDAMRLLAPHLQSSPRRTAPRRALLMPLPGEQHTFGVAMVGDFFRQAGWEVWSGAVATDAGLAAMLGRQHVDLIGFSLASDDFVEPARAHIAEARRASCNPQLVIMVGGPSFLGNPERALSIGADGTADDAPQAVAHAERLVARAAPWEFSRPKYVIDNGPRE